MDSISFLRLSEAIPFMSTVQQQGLRRYQLLMSHFVHAALTNKLLLFGLPCIGDSEINPNPTFNRVTLCVVHVEIVELGSKWTEIGRERFN